MSHLSLKQRQWFWAYVFLAPSLLFFAVFVIFPMLRALQYSLFYWPLGVPTKTFVGAENYRRLIFDDRVFLRTIWNTLYFTVGTLVPTMVIGLVLALILNMSELRWRPLFRTVYFIPVISSLVAVGFVWRWLLEPSFGLVNYILRLASIKGPGWLANPQWALPGVMLMTIWRDVGFYMIIFLAGLQTIPRDLREAGMVDGANAWQRFWGITLPLLNPSIVFAAVIGVINGLQLFTAVYVMTGVSGPAGGPLDSTRSVVLYIVDSAFRSQDIGYASAAASILFAIILLFALLQIRLTERPFEY